MQVVTYLLEFLLPEVYLLVGSFALEVLIHRELLHPIAVEFNSRDCLHEALQFTTVVLLVTVLEVADQVLQELVALEDFLLDCFVKLGEV